MTKNNPLVSVLMTVYNREKYIGEAIESILTSTYQNWELIIVDDRSKDSSVAIAKKYAEQDNRIKVFVNSVNLGDYPNRNRAASYAKGKYIKYVDADDKIYPHGLELLVYYMEQFPDSGYGLCSLEQDKMQIYPFEISPKEAYNRHYIEKKSIFHKAPLSAIIKKEVFDEVGGFTGKRMLGDFEMWHILSQKFKVVLMPQGIVWYREHDEQEMSVYKKDPMQPFGYLLISEVFLKSKECPLSIKDIDFALKGIKYNQSRSVLSALKNHSFEKTKELKSAGNLSISSILRNIIKL
ncbi:glycosyltransferase family 2 protein [Winogradskyella flava]|uniref:glycosyltransferase family 2 protein n=1 Tax=Winogradskyella flava TaxID=1884876 RepID=UPI002492B585|nr:glycosyltransferase family 2 protein [Winogradskyella flava]